jgi:hypothetical protein
MNIRGHKKYWFGSALLAALGVLVGPGVASADESTVSTPVTPPLITPESGNSAFLGTHGVGTQGYVCLPTATGASWTVANARPEATLFVNVAGQPVEVVTHFLSPNTSPNDAAPNPLPFGNATWQSSLDSSKVWAQVEHSIAAGTDPSCPNTGSIACLLLQVIGAESGPAGGKSLNRTTFIQRLNTRGGSAPGAGCSVAADVGKQALVPYSADYYFFHQGR